MKGIKYIVTVFLTLNAFWLYAQREDAGNYDYDIEMLFGVNKNTNGGLIGGFSFKYGFRLEDNQFQFFGIDLANVKDPREVRYNTVLGNSYIFGKTNYLYAIRPYYGRELILFKKAPQQGVQVSVLGAVGPSIGIIAPYIIQYQVSRLETVREQYNPEVHQSRFNILGPGRIFEGMGNSDIAFGGNAKAAVYFEFGVFRSNVTGLELGYQLEGFTKEIPLMATTDSRQIFQSVYFTFFYGFRK
ncbi:hypothetical protein [Cecembia lonarensis]|uniref:Outer membrane protein beta-barrel domain-containing protein n=1 Tax=Cecembia lonarensis (strain CCUG 58316 / KCTC 22772 / LW9) TaxID=1225176 RepID=K1KXV0_CECL9|nr:hypothetical protein [Cecembia lonarensis]EKB48960.1 hypothetical protein B879_02449 [Cecembia lonarensis LW9]